MGNQFKRVGYSSVTWTEIGQLIEVPVTDDRQWRRMCGQEDMRAIRFIRSMDKIKFYGLRYGCYFTPRVMKFVQRYGDVFSISHNSIMPGSGESLHDYFLRRETLYGGNTSDQVFDFSQETPSSELSFCASDFE